MSDFWPTIKIVLAFSLAIGFVSQLATDLSMSYKLPAVQGYGSACHIVGNETVCEGMAGTSDITVLSDPTQAITNPSTLGDFLASIYETIKGLAFFILFAGKSAAFIGPNLINLGAPAQIAWPIHTIAWLSYLSVVGYMLTGKSAEQ